MSGIYQERGRERDSFAVLALAYDNNLSLTSDEIVRVAQLYRLYDYPYKAATIVEKGINAGRIKKNKKNWEELGNAWFQSRHMKKAVQPLTNAASLAKEGDIYLRLCQTHASDEAWDRAARDCNNAINKGGLKTNGGLAQLVPTHANGLGDQRVAQTEAMILRRSMKAQRSLGARWAFETEAEMTNKHVRTLPVNSSSTWNERWKKTRRYRRLSSSRMLT